MATQLRKISRLKVKRGGAPKGNRFWQHRGKHGRRKLFATPELLWEAACRYFEWCDNNPWVKSYTVKSGINAGASLKVPVARPYTLSGLCLFLRCSKSYFRAFKSQGRQDAEDFITVITRVEDIIYTQQLEGVIVGVFNSNIVARKLDLTSKKSHSTKSETPVSPESDLREVIAYFNKA